MSLIGPSLSGIVLTILFAIFAIIATIYLINRQRDIAATISDDRRVEPLRGSHVTATLLGLGFGLVASILFMRLPTDSRLSAVAPVVFGFVAIAFITIPQFVYYRRAIEPGVAGIENRGLFAYTSRPLLMVVGGALASLLIMLLAGGLTASENDLGRKAALAFTCDDTSYGSFGPYPGSYYGIPLAIALALLTATTIAAVAFIARRPRNSADLELVRIDNLVRNMATDSILGAFGTSVGLIMIGLGFITGSRITYDCLSEWQDVLLSTFAVLGFAGIVVTFLSMRRLVVPRSLSSLKENQ